MSDAVALMVGNAALLPTLLHFPEEAASFFGTTGWAVLNAAGDRQFGDFDFWAIRPGESSRQWTRVARYNTATKELVRDEP